MKFIKYLILIISILILTSLSYIFFFKNTSLPPIDNFPVEVLSFDLLKEKIYLAINGQEKINYNLEVKDSKNATVTFKSLNPKIAVTSEDGLITGINEGKTSIILQVGKETRAMEVIVTNLIQEVPDNFDYNKKILECNQYTKEENDLLDEILLSRVNDRGYKTRAGVIAAIKFLTMEFPYRIPYFNENGRLTTFNVYPYIDGEGRYYHLGLYLNESRYQLLAKSSTNPTPWGCPLYAKNLNRTILNGLDCSGFITWAFYQAGFDPGDIGAGITKYPDLTDLGEKIKINDVNSWKIGDLLSGKSLNGGHIAMLVKKTNDLFYVAESLWPETGYYGVIIRTYNINELKENFAWYINMDKYYLNDGNLTNLW